MTRPRTENPFVGPRSLGESDPLYGRNSELARLRDRLVSDRIVLLYSPSGAGKSSLIEAGLRHELREKQFCVPPTIRLGGANAGSPDTPDRYEQAVVASLRNGRAPLATEEVPLSEHLQELESASDEELCLIFDQFEELFILDPADHEGRQHFLQKLGAILRNRKRWALFVIREDFIAQLDPYLELFPTLLTSRMRLELLTPEAAAAAIRGPAAEAGRPFSEGAVGHLVDDLRRVKRVGHDKSIPGPFVEPVQLQVVCLRVWNAAAEHEQPTIEENRIEESGGVDLALRLYYADQVAAAAEATGVNEALIRSWVGGDLVDRQGFRRPAIAPPSRGERGARLIEILEHAHLLRTEQRQGNRWYELAHDRLVAPIVGDNEQWARTHRDDPIVRADLWEPTRSPDLLLRRSALRRAATWQASHADELRDIDAQFLKASRQRRWYRRAMLTAVAIAVLALVAAGQAARVRSAAKKDHAIAQAAQLADGAGVQVKAGERSLALLLSLEGLRRSGQFLGARALGEAISGNDRPLGIVARLNNYAYALGVSPDGTRVVVGQQGLLTIVTLATGHVIDVPYSDFVRQVSWSPDGKYIGTAAFHFPPTGRHETRLLVYDSATGSVVSEINTHAADGSVAQTDGVAFGPDGSLYSGHSDGTLRKWTFDAGHLQEVRRVIVAERADRIAVDPANKWVAYRTRDAKDSQEAVEVRRADNLALVAATTAQPQSVSGIVFHPTRAELSYGSDDGNVHRWNFTASLSDGKSGVRANPETLNGHAQLVTNVAYSPTGRFIASTSIDRTIRLWDTSSGKTVRVLTGHEDWAWDVAFGRDDRTLYSVSGDRTLRRWEAIPSDELRFRAAHAQNAASPHITPDGTKLVTIDSFAREIIVWDATTLEILHRISDKHLEQYDKTPDTDGYLEYAGRVTLTPDGMEAVAASDDGAVRTYDLASGTEVGQPFRHDAFVNHVAVSGDGRLVALADGKAIVWDLNTRKEFARIALPNDIKLYSATFSTNSKFMSTTASDSVVRIYDTATWSEVAEWKATTAVHSMAWSPDSRRIVTGDERGTLVFRKPDGTIERSLQGPGVEVDAISFSPDGVLLAATGNDGPVRLWDLANDRLIGIAGGFETGDVEQADKPTGVAFTPDGNHLIRTSTDRSARLVALPRGWIALACTVAGRNLTMEEWARYTGSTRGYLRLCPDYPVGDGAPQAAGIARGLVASLERALQLPASKKNTSAVHA